MKKIIALILMTLMTSLVIERGIGGGCKDVDCTSNSRRVRPAQVPTPPERSVPPAPEPVPRIFNRELFDSDMALIHLGDTDIIQAYTNLQPPDSDPSDLLKAFELHIKYVCTACGLCWIVQSNKVKDFGKYTKCPNVSCKRWRKCTNASCNRCTRCDPTLRGCANCNEALAPDADPGRLSVCTHIPRAQEALLSVCKNYVGSAMLKLILANKMAKCPDKTITLLINDHADAGGSSFSPAEFSVNVNLNRYKSDGSGIDGADTKYYWGVTPDRTSVALNTPKTLARSMFHEFTHLLHDVEGVPSLERLPVLVRQAWDDPHEYRTIAGHIKVTTHASAKLDPVCENCFDWCDCLSRNSAQEFRPRCGHNDDAAAIQNLYAVQYAPRVARRLFNLDWVTKY